MDKYLKKGDHYKQDGKVYRLIDYRVVDYFNYHKITLFLENSVGKDFILSQFFILNLPPDLIYKYLRLEKYIPPGYGTPLYNVLHNIDNTTKE
jgi:hypothetical protein